MISIDQPEFVQYKYQILHGFAVMENIFSELRKELMLIQPLKERIFEIQIIVRKLMSENKKVKKAIESLREAAVRKISSFAASKVEMLSIMDQLILFNDSYLTEMFATGLQVENCEPENERLDIAMKYLKEDNEQKINALKSGTDANFAKIATELETFYYVKLVEANLRLQEFLEKYMEKEIKTLKVEDSSFNAYNIMFKFLCWLEQQMGSYDLSNQVLETTNYNGELIWKIQDFKQRINEAKRGDAIYSQSSYISRYGYKMCLTAYLNNGDDIGKNTHIYLYFVLMKGEYDVFLSFPFNHKVKLFLLDRTPEKHHWLLDEFIPDSSSSFKKPISNMNIASGYPMYVLHDKLKKYVVNDKIEIKVVVDIKTWMDMIDGDFTQDSFVFACT